VSSPEACLLLYFYKIPVDSTLATQNWRAKIFTSTVC